jgi:adenosylhomocysteinase
MLMEGMQWEKKFLANKELPDPARGNSEEEKCLLTVLRREIQKNPQRFT